MRAASGAIAAASPPEEAAALDPMRTLILFLTLLLPLQLSWAAMASYCQTEKGSSIAGRNTQASHPGHHDHAGTAKTTTADTNTDTDTEHGKKAEQESGCPVCQFSAMKSVQWAHPGLADAFCTVLDVFCTGAPHPRSHIADGPDKPNWLLAA